MKSYIPVILLLLLFTCCSKDENKEELELLTTETTTVNKNIVNFSNEKSESGEHTVEGGEDSDNDGVNDDSDACPETPAGETVNETGCSIALMTFVPDDNFEQRLIDLGLDDVLNDYVLTSNISDIEKFRLEGNDFPAYTPIDLTGLEDFSSLNELELLFIEGLVINLSNYPSLKKLFMQEVFMKTLEIDENSNLEELALEDSAGIEKLTITDNNSLITFSFEKSFIDTMIITGNTQLEGFGDFDGDYGDVVIANNEALRWIGFSETDKIQKLKLGNNNALETFDLNLGNSTIDFSFDFSTCPNLKTIDFSFRGGDYKSIDISKNCNLETLLARNCGLIALDVTHNEKLAELDIQNNPDLTCVKVNATQLANIPAGWLKDDITSYALDCP